LPSNDPKELSTWLDLRLKEIMLSDAANRENTHPRRFARCLEPRDNFIPTHELYPYPLDDTL